MRTTCFNNYRESNIRGKILQSKDNQHSSYLLTAYSYALCLTFICINSFANEKIEHFIINGKYNKNI